MVTVMTETTPDTDAIADRARRVVASVDLSQREFAARIGMDPTALSKALRGNRRLQDHELKSIARVGKVPVDYLRTGAGRPDHLDAGPAPASARRRAESLEAEQRRLQILEATARLIARRGFHNVRVADIARECGTSTGTVHYHFPSKDDALRAALTFYADRLHSQVDEGLSRTDDIAAMLRTLIEIQLPKSDADRDEWSVWIQFWNEAILQPALRHEHHALYGSWRGVVVDLLQRAQDEGLATGVDVEAMAGRFTGMVDGLAIQVMTGFADMTVDVMREILLDAFEPHIRLRPS